MQERGGGLRIELGGLYIRADGSIELLVFLVSTAQVDVGGRLFPAAY